MGAGKTAVGHALADRLKRRFVDLDEAVETRLEMSIPEVFATLGEEAFRRAETDELARATRRGGLVVATGGGTFSVPSNRRLIDDSGGVSVFLDPPWKVLRRRIETESASRPKWIDERQARRLAESRRADYLRATVHLKLDGAESPQQVAQRVVQELAEAACAS